MPVSLDQGAVTEPSGTAAATTRLVINADDFGLTPGVCEGILHGFDHGVVTSTSALVVAPAFETFAVRLRESALPAGIHLCAVGEDPPLCAPAEIPSLVDADGAFARNWKQFLVRAATGRIRSSDLDREFTAQIECLLHHGIIPTHVDTHQHLHLLPGVTGLVLDLADRHGIPAVRVIRTHRLRPVPIGVRALAAIASTRTRWRGLITSDTSDGLEDAGAMCADALSAALNRLGRRDGIADLTVHPGAAADPDRSRYRWGYRWAEELDSLCDPRTFDRIQKSGFKLASYRDLAR